MGFLWRILRLFSWCLKTWEGVKKYSRKDMKRSISKDLVGFQTLGIEVQHDLDEFLTCWALKCRMPSCSGPLSKKITSTWTAGVRVIKLCSGMSEKVWVQDGKDMEGWTNLNSKFNHAEHTRIEKRCVHWQIINYIHMYILIHAIRCN